LQVPFESRDHVGEEPKGERWCRRASFERKKGRAYRLTEKEGNSSLGSNPVREQLAAIVGSREFEGGRDQMVSTRSRVNEKM